MMMLQLARNVRAVRTVLTEVIRKPFPLARELGADPDPQPGRRTTWRPGLRKHRPDRDIRVVIECVACAETVQSAIRFAGRAAHRDVLRPDRPGLRRFLQTLRGLKKELTLKNLLRNPQHAGPRRGHHHVRPVRGCGAADRTRRVSLDDIAGAFGPGARNRKGDRVP
jgi:threonine dehydrogenase-like Zn-dependent dehydrogenase